MNMIYLNLSLIWCLRMSSFNNKFAHPYWLWEDYQNGMFNDEMTQDGIKKAMKVLGNPDECRKAMKRVLDEWQYVSQTVLLTDIKFEWSSNRSWLGASCCCIQCGCTQNEVRNAWWLLTDEQRDIANKIADDLIDEYRNQYLDYQMKLF